LLTERTFETRQRACGEGMKPCIVKRSPFIKTVNSKHTTVFYEPVSHYDLVTGLFEILTVIRTELLDPQWGQHVGDVINPDEDVSPRIVAEKIALALQSIVSSKTAVLLRALASGE
jgi:hypothetical protein